MKKIKNIKIYVFTIVVAILLIILSFILKSMDVVKPLILLADIASGIGCSGLAAAVMAIFLDGSSDKREKKILQQAKYLYFKEFNNQLSMLIGRILWFDERVDEEGFNWEYDEETYSTLRYMISVGRKYKERNELYEDAIIHLKQVGEKYSIEKMPNLSENKKKTVEKMFRIIAASSAYLLKEVLSINDSKLILSTENYLSLEEIRIITFNIPIIFSLMEKSGKNYKAAIDMLVQVSDRIRDTGGYTNDICVGLHNNISLDEL